MSPLAQMVVKADLKAAVAGHSQALPELQTSECHCFETSEVLELVTELARNHKWKAADDSHFFLPSPITWIEWKTVKGRSGVLLYNTTSVKGAKVSLSKAGSAAGPEEHRLMQSATVGTLVDYTSGTDQLRLCDSQILIGRTDTGVLAGAGDGFSNADLLARTRLIAATLVLINTPRVIGRVQITPHAGLQRQIAASKKMVGKFPLQAWSEIKLEVTPPRVDGGSEHVGRLSGGKALHFCRAHLRIRRGQLERVSSHWRGDPSLGIKQTRYALVKPQSGQGLQT